jgi:hypothetical protein
MKKKKKKTKSTEWAFKVNMPAKLKLRFGAN